MRAALSGARRTAGAARLAFCHGDFRCTQLLRDADRWTVVDFDDCVRGDPMRDLAWSLALLKYDIGFLRDAIRSPDAAWRNALREAQSAYAGGYLERSGVDAGRLAWRRLGAEIAYVAQLLRRGTRAGSRSRAASI